MRVSRWGTVQLLVDDDDAAEGCSTPYADRSRRADRGARSIDQADNDGQIDRHDPPDKDPPRRGAHYCSEARDERRCIATPCRHVLVKGGACSAVPRAGV